MRLVLCFDGTSNGPMSARTNVLKLWLSIERNDSQLTFYDPGVGTLAPSGALTTIGQVANRSVDLATGVGLRENVLQAYRFLVDHWRPGDEVFMFGFSRGAYTARALCGMLHMVGLVDPGGENLVDYLWHIYSAKRGPKVTFERRMRVSSEIRALNHRVPVKLLGLWDTVSSWGWYFNFQSLPFTSKCPDVESIRHAVAIDELRGAFKHNLFDHESNEDLQEVWFPGGHGDVGGGFEESESGLSKVPLAWMYDQAEAHGLQLCRERVDKYLGGSNRPGRTQYAAPDPCGPMHDSVKGLWWALEFIPRKMWDWRLKRHVLRANNFRRRDPWGSSTLLHASIGERVTRLNYRAPGLVEPPEAPE